MVKVSAYDKKEKHLTTPDNTYSKVKSIPWLGIVKIE
jgi:hypothetical protein